DGDKLALVLPGGGARGAFQVGVLKAIAELLPRTAHNPFNILSGTSAGAINATVVASKARRLRFAAQELERVWGGFSVDQVFRSDRWTMFKTSAHWLAAIVLGGLGPRNPRSLLDNAPLRALLHRNVPFDSIQRGIDRGYLDALAVTAAGYSSARSVSFYQAAPRQLPWQRTRRVGVHVPINLDHLMASIAVPMVFPPQLIDGEYYGDGAMRQATPLSPAVNLGADRILVIGVRNELASPAADPAGASEFPSFGQIAGYMLDTLFLDGLYSDLERLSRINTLLDAVKPQHREGVASRLRPIDCMIIVPSRDLRSIAAEHAAALPAAVRLLLRGVGGRQYERNRLLSFLLFESGFTKALIQLGYDDAMRVREPLLNFLTGGDVPRLFAPRWLRRDLTSL
ncbi:MAG: patatin-like phospholipase family protein, partial [Pseudomonadota bacterium]